jgi:hypothetical protein
VRIEVSTPSAPAERVAVRRAKAAGGLVQRRIDLVKHRVLEQVGRSPVVVYSGPKTGSTTRHHTLARAHLGRPTYQVHELDEELEARNENARAKRGKEIPEARLAEARRLRTLARDGTTAFTIVTSVRDPISRAISSFFQSSQSIGLVYAAHRRAVLAQLRLTPDEIELAQSTRTMQHYFSADERTTLVRSWSAGFGR